MFNVYTIWCKVQYINSDDTVSRGRVFVAACVFSVCVRVYVPA